MKIPDRQRTIISSDVGLEQWGRVATISFGSSGSRYLTTTIVEELETAFSAAARDASVIMITGIGSVFSLGADLAKMESMSEGDLDGYLAAGQQLMETIAGSPVPTVAAVNGAALGGGFELALSCDIRWCHPRAVFQLPESRLGLLPAWGAARRLRDNVSPGTAMELLCGLRVSARTAQTLGLVSRIIAARDFRTEAMASAATIAEAPRMALKSVKSLWFSLGGKGLSDLERAFFAGLHRQNQKNKDHIMRLEESA